MPDNRKSCIDEIIEALGGHASRDSINDHFEEINDRADGYESDGMGRNEALGKAADEILKEMQMKSAILRRNMRIDALKLRDLRNFIDASPRLEDGIEARLTGLNTPFFDQKSRAGNQLSAGALALGTKKDWIGGVVTDLQRLSRDKPELRGLDNLFYSRAIEDDIFREKWQLDSGDSGKPGITKNPAALEIAKVLHKWDKVRVDALNNEGAWISSYKGFITRLTHDPDRIRRASRPITPGDPKNYFYRGFAETDRAVWVDTVLKHIDAKRTFGNRSREEVRQALSTMYGGFVTGDHLEMELAPDQKVVGPNIARKVSQERTLHWKSAEDWLAYNKTFGRYSPTDAWLHNVGSSANHLALMKVFGSRPKENFDELLTYAKNKVVGKPERLTLDKREPALRNRYAVVSGEADRPVASLWAGIFNGWMAVQRVAKLGLTPFAMLQDNVTISRELSRHGLNYVERNISMLGGYFQGAEGSAKREVAELLHTGILNRLRGVTSRFDISDARAGSIAKMENWFFKITGITAMTENKRADAERMMAYALGKKRGTAFADLGESETRLLQAFGLGEKEWDLLHKVEWNRIENETYLTPDIAKKISDENITAYLEDLGADTGRGQAMIELNKAGVISRAPERARDELALKLWSYYSERGNFAVLDTGPREKAILYQGTQSGTPLNTALRLFMQFKQFPTAMITKAWGAEVYGGAKGMDRIAGLVELAVASTLFGILANALNDTVKLQDPTARWRNQPLQALTAGFLRGGAGSVYGDFLLGQWSRFGLSALDTIAGPTFGQINSVAEFWTDLTHAKADRQTGALGVRLLRQNLPFLNMIYTRAAFDYLVMYRLQEYLNPGYLKRMERSMKDKAGTEFLLKPSKAVK